VSVLTEIDLVQRHGRADWRAVPYRGDTPHDSVDVIEIVDVVLVVRAWHIAPQGVRWAYVDELAVAIGAACLRFHPVGLTRSLCPNDDDGARLIQRIADLGLVVAPALRGLVLSSVRALALSSSGGY
jgi:hypothetical protein